MTDQPPTSSVIVTPAQQSAEPNADLATMDWDTLLLEKSRILDGKLHFQELSIEEMERFSAICSRLRMMARPAGKPAGTGTRRVAKKKVVSVDDL